MLKISKLLAVALLLHFYDFGRWSVVGGGFFVWSVVGGLVGGRCFVISFGNPKSLKSNL